MHGSDKKKKWLKQHQSHLLKVNSHCKQSFSPFWCIPCTAMVEISSSRKNINNTFRVSNYFYVFYDYALNLFLYLWDYVRFPLEDARFSFHNHKHYSPYLHLYDIFWSTFILHFCRYSLHGFIWLYIHGKSIAVWVFVVKISHLVWKNFSFTVYVLMLTTPTPTVN